MTCPRCHGLAVIDTDGDYSCLICAWSSARREPTPFETATANMQRDRQHVMSTMLADGSKLRL